MPRVVWVLLAFVLAVPVLAGEGEKEEKGEKPQLQLRATPRFAFSPASILFTAELKGGDDIERYYCPEVEWEWGDGGRSVSEADCDPWEPDTKIARRFTNRHVFQFSGNYRVRVTLSKAGKDIAAQNINVQVRPGLGDQR